VKEEAHREFWWGNIRDRDQLEEAHREFRWGNMRDRDQLEEAHREFRWGNMRDRDQLEDLLVNGRIILKCILTFRRRNFLLNFSTLCI
jgi:hypothetical protein